MKQNTGIFWLLIIILGVSSFNIIDNARTRNYTKEAIHSIKSSEAVVEAIEMENVALMDSIKVLSAAIKQYEINIIEQNEKITEHRSQIQRLRRRGITTSERDSLIRAINQQ